jgi:hypothetical protein
MRERATVNVRNDENKRDCTGDGADHDDVGNNIYILLTLKIEMFLFIEATVRYLSYVIYRYRLESWHK